MRRIVPVVAIAMLLAYAAVAYHLHTYVLEGYSDFISFYTAAKILRSGQGHRLYDLNLQYEIQQQTAPSGRIRAGALPFVRPAYEAWLFVPLAGMSYTAAFGIWSGVTLILVVLIAVLLRRHVRGLEQVPTFFLLLILLSYFPVFITLLQGQDSVLLLCIFCLVFIELQKGKERTGGMLLGLGWFKFPLMAVFLVPFVVARRFRVLFGSCITSLALLAVSIATTGWRAFLDYPRYLLRVNRLATGINNPRDMPNVRGLVDVAGAGVLSPVTLNVIVAAMSLALVTWLATKHRRFTPGDSGVFTLAFALDLVVMLLAGYHAHVFDLVLLVPAMAIATGFCLSDTAFERSTRMALTIVTACLLCSPLYFIVALTLRYTTLLATLLFAATIVFSRAINDIGSSTELKMQARPVS
jgi:hypothetical protein